MSFFLNNEPYKYVSIELEKELYKQWSRKYHNFAAPNAGLLPNLHVYNFQVVEKCKEL